MNDSCMTDAIYALHHSLGLVDLPTPGYMIGLT
jgi:hypothetical protein